MSDNKKLQIRNSTAEFLTFAAETGEQSIEVLYANETVWATQRMISELYHCSTDNVSLHLKNLYSDNEITEKTTTEYFSVVQHEGSREVNRKLKFYNLDAIIAIGFKVNSERAVQFRQWAINVLRLFSVRGYVLDKERMENGAFLGEDYFEHLLEEIREIRASERRFYQKITDIYAMAMDYNISAPTTKQFFASVQNKLHFAIHGHTAAEVIVERANAEKDHMGLTSWKNAPDGKIVKSDVSVAKNYLNKDEIDNLNRIVTMYLDYAELQAKRHLPMTMEDWATKLNAFLQFNEQEILSGSGKVSAEIAKAFAESEFEKYRIKQDRLYKSDFDKLLEENMEGEKSQ
jgi:hypothetical protein